MTRATTSSLGMYVRLPMHAIHHSLRLFGILGAVFFTAGPASAQCTYQWVPGDGLPGLNGPASAAVDYDDGFAPVPFRSVV